MWVIFFQTLTDYTGALHIAFVVLQTFGVHRIENAAMHRLQPVTNIGQRAPDDD